MTGAMSDWKRYALQGATLGVAVFAAIRAAHAWEGTQNVQPRSHFTVAGTLTGASPSSVLRFTFRNATGSCPVSVPLSPANYDGLHFNADLDYTPCQTGSVPFDGRNVNVDVQIDGTPVVIDAGINPVPYAQFAANAGSAFNAADGGPLATSIPWVIPRGPVAVITAPALATFSPSAYTSLFATSGGPLSFQSGAAGHILVHFNSTVQGNVPGGGILACSVCDVVDGDTTGPTSCLSVYGRRRVVLYTPYFSSSGAAYGTTDAVDISFDIVRAIDPSRTIHTVDIQVQSNGTPGSTCEFGGGAFGNPLIVTVLP